MLGLARGSRLRECLGVLGAMPWSPRVGDFTGYGSVARVAGRLFALELSEGGPKLSLTDGRKQQLDGFSSNR